MSAAQDTINIMNGELLQECCARDWYSRTRFCVLLGLDFNDFATPTKDHAISGGVHGYEHVMITARIWASASTYVRCIRDDIELWIET